MARTARVAPGGLVFHVLNRGVARMQLFEKPADYQAFEQVLRETLDESSMRICAYTSDAESLAPAAVAGV
jgi:putative transposase